MHVLKEWNAKRAGAGLTVTGQNEAGETIKVVGVDRIAPGPHGEGYVAAFSGLDARAKLLV